MAALKSAALVIALLGFTEKVPLVCEGTATLNGLGEKPASMLVIIDLDAGTMETNLGVLTIANATDMELQLEKPSDSHSSFRSEIDAKFDLISGHLGVWDWRYNGGLKQYDLTCTKAATLL